MKKVINDKKTITTLERHEESRAISMKILKMFFIGCMAIFAFVYAVGFSVLIEKGIN